ncbi:MAG: group III truncated hemoglobin [Cyclobacteriaceae bacterium]
MTKQDIRSRSDLETLVHSFYAKVRKHADLGPFFNNMIDDWSLHMKRFTEFWYSNLFVTKTYKGKTLNKHVAVDNHFDYEIKKLHFNIWLELWEQSVDALYYGEKAYQAKRRARCMAQILCQKLFAARKEERNQIRVA